MTVSEIVQEGWLSLAISVSSLLSLALSFVFALASQVFSGSIPFIFGIRATDVVDGEHLQWEAEG